MDGAVVSIGFVDSNRLKVPAIGSVVVSTRDGIVSTALVVVDEVLFGISVAANGFSVSFSSISESSIRFFTFSRNLYFFSDYFIIRQQII